jgi:hypothetical protein
MRPATAFPSASAKVSDTTSEPAGLQLAGSIYVIARKPPALHFVLSMTLATTALAGTAAILACSPSVHSTRGLAMPDFEKILGRAAIELWPDLPQQVQERLFSYVPDDAGIRNGLAHLLHDRHPRTAHPPKPTALA